MVVPPLHSEIVTATLAVDDLRAAQNDLERRYASDAAYRPSPSQRHGGMGPPVFLSIACSHIEGAPAV